MSGGGGHPASAFQVRTGVDLAAVEAVRRSVTDFGDAYLKRVFTPTEIQQASDGADPSPARLAARFAAKEAAIKALDWCDAPRVWTEFEVRCEAHGAPRILLHGTAAERARRLGVCSRSVSLSHEGELALACVTLLCGPSPFAISQRKTST